MIAPLLILAAAALMKARTSSTSSSSTSTTPGQAPAQTKTAATSIAPSPLPAVDLGQPKDTNVLEMLGKTAIKTAAKEAAASGASGISSAGIGAGVVGALFTYNLMNMLAPGPSNAVRCPLALQRLKMIDDHVRRCLSGDLSWGASSKTFWKDIQLDWAPSYGGILTMDGTDPFDGVTVMPPQTRAEPGSELYRAVLSWCARALAVWMHEGDGFGAVCGSVDSGIDQATNGLLKLYWRSLLTVTVAGARGVNVATDLLNGASFVQVAARPDVAPHAWDSTSGRWLQQLSGAPTIVPRASPWNLPTAVVNGSFMSCSFEPNGDPVYWIVAADAPLTQPPRVPKSCSVLDIFGGAGGDTAP